MQYASEMHVALLEDVSQIQTDTRQYLQRCCIRQRTDRKSRWVTGAYCLSFFFNPTGFSRAGYFYIGNFLMISVSSTPGTSAANNAGTNLQIVAQLTNVSTSKTTSTGLVAFDTGNDSLGLIGLMIRAIQKLSPQPELSNDSPTKASPDGFATGVLKQLGFDVKNLKPHEIKTLGKALFDEMKSGRMKKAVENLQTKQKNLTYEEAAAAAQKRFLSNFANQSGIKLQYANNIVPVTTGKGASRSGCVAELVEVRTWGNDFLLKAKGTLFKDGKPDPKGTVTLKIEPKANNKRFTPKDENNIPQELTLTRGGGQADLPRENGMYLNLSGMNGLQRRKNIEIKAIADCVDGAGNKSKGESPVYKEPGFKKP